MGSFPDTFDDRPLLPCVGRGWALRPLDQGATTTADVNENGKKAKDLNKENTNFSLHVHHTFLIHFFAVFARPRLISTNFVGET